MACGLGKMLTIGLDERAWEDGPAVGDAEMISITNVGSLSDITMMFSTMVL